MPQIPKHRKAKRALLLLKRSQCVRNYPKYKSYKPLCEKLKSNNNLLAKALSKQKEEAQLLFSQNIALVAEVQDLGLACNKRDTIISNMLNNAKQMLEMLVTMTGYVTSTISMCQEFGASCGTNMQIPYNAATSRESFRGLSAKAPARGVVKPMVSGHTITKPTINLSRINAHFINPSNLSIIEEISTPPRNEELSNIRSPVAVPALHSPVRQHRYDTGRRRMMPERLKITSPRTSNENERRLSKRRSRHSTRMSGKQSKIKSGRSSGGHSTRCSLEFGENIGSPRVKLNDVSKLLQNSQTINIRMLTESQTERRSSSANNDETRKRPQPALIIPDTSSDAIEEDGNTSTRSPVDKSESESTTPKEAGSSARPSTSNTPDFEDPLEGPSWLLNDCSQYSDENQDSRKSSTPSRSHRDSLIHQRESTDFIAPLPVSSKRASNGDRSKTGLVDDSENSLSSSGNNLDDSSNVFNGSATSVEEKQESRQPAEKPNFPNFITQRRGYFANDEDDDDDDYTLILTRQPRNMNFDLNDLKLPVLEEPALSTATKPKEPEPEITATIQKICQTCPIPSLSNESFEDSMLDHSTVRLPLLLNNEQSKEATPRARERSADRSRDLAERHKRRARRANIVDAVDYVDSSPVPGPDNTKAKKNVANGNKDPSAAKVVLQKLNESDVKPRTPSPDEIYSQDNSRQYLKSPISTTQDNFSDSESSESASSFYSSAIRPRRKRAPANLQEPSLKRKLRRN